MLYIVYGLVIYSSFTQSNSRVVGIQKRKIQAEDENDDISIYSRSALESMLDDDELTPSEAAFMQGYEDAV